MDVIETAFQCSRKTMSSALVTVTCLSSPLLAVEPSEPSFPRHSNVVIAEEKSEKEKETEIQHLQEAILALEAQLELYRGRALYLRREADRLLTKDWISYRRYQSDARRYEQLSVDTENKIKDLQSQLKAIQSN